MRRVLILFLVGLLFFLISFFAAYKFFTLPELISLNQLVGLRFFRACGFVQGFNSLSVEYSFGEGVVL